MNEDGTPKVLYHGTNAEFFEFDKAKIQVDKDVFDAYVTVENIDDDFAFVSKETKMIIARDNVEQMLSFLID